MSEEEWEEWISDPLVLEKGGEVLLRREWVDILFEKYIFPALKTKGFQILGKPDTIMRRFLSPDKGKKAQKLLLAGETINLS